MKLAYLIKGTIIVTLLGLLVNCKINESVTAPVPGVISGSYYVSISDNSLEHYYFERGGVSYGNIIFYYNKYPSWADVKFRAPYGIKKGIGNVAPSNNYIKDWVDIELYQSYFFRPDSCHYGYIEIKSLKTNSSCFIGFLWLIQTKPYNPTFY
jgi:hypothetical protein